MIATLFSLYVNLAVISAYLLAAGFLLGLGIAVAERLVESIWHR